ncbi:MAG: helix-turn-helix transcriptional regulator [Lachnospiraceae bacterium]|nr:helix-turn-helix transcriptional regulator [Lachnospiraceae bacterium]
MTFGEKLKQLRERQGLSQEKLSEKLNVSRQVITKWENGTGIPRIENLKALADFFHVTIDELLGRTEASNADLMTEYRRTIEALREYTQTTVHLLDQAIMLGSRMAIFGNEGANSPEEIAKIRNEE